MESNTNAEIQGAKAASRNLSSKLYKLDQESLKQQEIVYNQVGSFKITFRAVKVMMRRYCVFFYYFVNTLFIWLCRIFNCNNLKERWLICRVKEVVKKTHISKQK